jgi:hypothetical protein
MHFGQCAGLLLPLRPPSSVGCFPQARCSTDSPPPHDPLNCHRPPRAFVKSVEPECSRRRTAVVDNCLARVRSGIPCPASVASGRSCLPGLSGRSSYFSGVPFGDLPGFWFSSAEGRFWNPRAENAQLVTAKDQACWGARKVCSRNLGKLDEKRT